LSIYQTLGVEIYALIIRVYFSTLVKLPLGYIYLPYEYIYVYPMGTYIYPIGIFFNPCTACWGIYIYPMVIYIYPMGIHIYLWEYFSTLVKLPLGYIYLPYGYTSTMGIFSNLCQTAL